jgi:methylmalonyl-CoA/ethylmalonyl-CoA epimerase
MNNLKVHHIGYLVKKINRSKETFESLGYRSGEITHDISRGIDICFLTKDGLNVELVSPFTEDSIVSGIMSRYKNCAYHICYESAQFEDDLKSLGESGFHMIGEPLPAPAINGRRVVFLMNPSIGMIELLES